MYAEKQVVTKKRKGRPGLSGTAPAPPFRKSLDLFQDPGEVRRMGATYWRKKQNRDQVREIFRGAKLSNGDLTLLKSGVALKYCNNSFLMRETPSGTMHTVSTWNCGRKFCAICSGKKRRKLLHRYLTFFESDSGSLLLDSYDLALFTVTLQHSKDGIRQDPYYKELSEHWRNGLKYGAFKRYFAGGFYNTEHTYGKNGHHIHRHALVLIPKEENLYDNLDRITSELREQWKKRTGGSFQIDLSPIRKDKTLKENLLEVTKYVTKRGKEGVVPWQIVKAIGENSRHKFYGKFGLLHKIKELNLNFLEEAETVETHPEELTRSTQGDKLFICSGLKVISTGDKPEKGKKPEYINFYFREKTAVPNLENSINSFLTSSHIATFNELLRLSDRYRTKYFFKEWTDWRNLKERLETMKPNSKFTQETVELFN
jgi:hypothetical protein